MDVKVEYVFNKIRFCKLNDEMIGVLLELKLPLISVNFKIVPTNVDVYLIYGEDEIGWTNIKTQLIDSFYDTLEELN